MTHFSEAAATARKLSVAIAAGNDLLRQRIETVALRVAAADLVRQQDLSELASLGVQIKIDPDKVTSGRAYWGDFSTAFPDRIAA